MPGIASLRVNSQYKSIMSMCPRGCGTQLALADKQGVSIDYCPQCRGIWLDHGELEKLIEKADASYRQPSAQSIDHLMPPRDNRSDDRYSNDRYDSRRDDDRRRYRDDDDDDDDNRGRRRGGLGSFFDIFD